MTLAGERFRAVPTDWDVVAAFFERVRRRRVVLHAAAVERRGRTLVLAGAHGRGKSTLALALRLRGWRLLADDLVVVEPDGAVQAVERPVRIKRGIAKALPELRDGPSVLPLRASGPRRARAVIVFGPHRGRLRLESMGAGAAVGALARLAWNFRDVPRDVLAALAALTRKARAFRLSGGTVPQRCAAAEELVDARR